MAVSIDQQFIEYIVKSLVNNPDKVSIERRIDEKGVLLELSVDPEDLGRVIGKRGATAQSLRTLLRALGTKNDARYNLKIVDTGPPPERSDSRRSSSDDRDEPARDDKGDDRADQILPSEPDDTPVNDAVASTSDDVDMADDEELPETASRDHSDVVSRTRKELAELDDLDV
jgi:predicted RNA-binding protein YlqC (UPF0109 family)